MYPHGKAKDGDGVVDLAGNVWEWCLNEYHKAERTQREGTESRVLRGGSWNGSQVSARAGCRNSFHPDGRLNNVGFRVVCSSPISGTLGR